jgi:nitroreductase
MDKPAPVDHPVCTPVRQRWSPRAFADRPIDEPVLRSLLEAARWAPSSSNSQPWRFIVARREERERFDRIGACLAPANRRWAEGAAVLMVALARKADDEGRALRHGAYDTGQAVAWLSCEATDRGLRVHQMAGFDADRVRAEFAVGNDLTPLTAIALGHPGDPNSLPEDLREQELGARVRIPQSEMIISG